MLAWKIHAHCTGLGSILVTVQDISELEQLRYTLTDTEAVLHDTRRELQEQTEVFGTMESMARTGYWRRIRDEGESVLLWSPGLCDIAGFERQEWIGTERALSGVLPEDLHVVASAPEGEPAAFKLIAIDKTGKQVAAKGAAWTLKRLSRDWQWFKMDGEWRWEGITRTSKIANGVIDIAADQPTDFARTLSWGEYRLEIAADGMTPVSMDFSAGYYYGDTSKADTPDTLKVALDTTDAKSGDTVNVKIEARYAGKATVQVVGDRLLSSQTIDVPEGGLCLLYTSPSPRDRTRTRMPSSA